MGEICGLKFHLIYVHTPQIFFWNPSMQKRCHFYFIKMPKIANSVVKITFFAHEGIWIICIVMHVYIINETLSHKFYPYSTLDNVRIFFVHRAIKFIYSEKATEFHGITLLFYITLIPGLMRIHVMQILPTHNCKRFPFLI